MAIQADVTMNSEIIRTIREVEEGLGPIDILVNNAGSLVERLRTLELTEERWDEVVDLERLRIAYVVINCIDGANWVRLGNASIFQ